MLDWAVLSPSSVYGAAPSASQTCHAHLANLGVSRNYDGVPGKGYEGVIYRLYRNT